MRYGDSKFAIRSTNPLVERDNRKNIVDIVLSCHFYTTTQITSDVMTKRGQNLYAPSFLYIFYIYTTAVLFYKQ